MRPAGETLVVSCYELGHQPLAAASALGFLEREGFRASAVDLAVEPERRIDELIRTRGAALVAISVPMHTALHVGVRAARRIRRIAPGTHICFFGLYASLNAEHLLDGLADSVISGEFERPLVDLARAIGNNDEPTAIVGLGTAGRNAKPCLERLPFPVPSRDRLPALDRYAKLAVGNDRRLAAAVEASRGCLHLCRHCPIPPIYGGRFFVVPREVVLEDIRRLAARGVRHVSFADPDFFNGPGHSMAIVRAMHAEHPELTFDVTTKIEHVLEHRAMLGELAKCGCLFVVSAVESLSDEVLTHLSKGHERDDVFQALALLRDAGIVLRPSLVAFTPWTTLDDYLEVLDWVAREELIDQLDPVQYSIRLLVPPGSGLVELDAMRPHLRRLEPARFFHAWEHPDPRMDRLHAEVASLVQDAALREEDARRTFACIQDAAETAAERAPRRGIRLPARARARPPRLTEPWFC